MSEHSFETLLRRAMNRDHDAIEDILEMYKPLINHYSYKYGCSSDEDWKQYIMMQIVIDIPGFKI